MRVRDECGAGKDASAGPTVGTIDIELGGARVRVSGALDAAAFRQALSRRSRNQ